MKEPVSWELKMTTPEKDKWPGRLIIVQKVGDVSGAFMEVSDINVRNFEGMKKRVEKVVEILNGHYIEEEIGN